MNPTIEGDYNKFKEGKEALLNFFPNMEMKIKTI